MVFSRPWQRFALSYGLCVCVCVCGCELSVLWVKQIKLIFSMRITSTSIVIGGWVKIRPRKGRLPHTWSTKFSAFADNFLEKLSGAVLAPPLFGGSNGGMGLQIWAGHWKTFVGHIYTYAVYDKM